MSKSLGNYIGITEAPENIYGKVLSISDTLMFRYYELLSDLSAQEIAKLQAGIDQGELHPKEVKKQLARELTARFHGQAAAQAAEAEFERVFQKKELPDDMAEVSLPTGEAIWLPQLLLDAGLVVSTSEGRRMIQQGAVAVDGEKAGDVNGKIAAIGEVILKVGKRRFAKVVFR